MDIFQTYVIFLPGFKSILFSNELLLPTVPTRVFPAGVPAVCLLPSCCPDPAHIRLGAGVEMSLLPSCCPDPAHIRLGAGVEMSWPLSVQPASLLQPLNNHIIMEFSLSRQLH